MGYAAPHETRKARKQHWCYWCGEVIERGSLYVRWAWFDDGTVLTVKVHPECQKAWASLRFPDNEEVMFGDYNRGCTCGHGMCECELRPVEDKT